MCVYAHIHTFFFFRTFKIAHSQAKQIQISIWKVGLETYTSEKLLRKFWCALNTSEKNKKEKPTCVALSLMQGVACPRLSRGQCPARYGAARVSREEVRRIMLEGLEEGGCVLSPRYKAKVLI